MVSSNLNMFQFYERENDNNIYTDQLGVFLIPVYYLVIQKISEKFAAFDIK